MEHHNYFKTRSGSHSGLVATIQAKKREIDECIETCNSSGIANCHVILFMVKI
jgi:hypothetical protein